jgi:type III pantothenate kinase
MRAPADFLLIDIGNTSTKLRRASRRALIGPTLRLPTAQLTPPLIIESLGRWSFRCVVLSSVVPIAAQTVLATLPEPIFQVGSRLDLGVDLSGYPRAQTLGADRLANVAGALALHGPPPLIVVDFGTAATFNAIDAGGRFLGGVIAPGLAAMTRYLPDQTAKLPVIKLREPARAIGRSTREAMLAGTVHGYRGMIKEIIARLRAELGPAKVVGAGGDARFLAAGLPDIDVVDTTLTLQGLRVIGSRLFGQTKASKRHPQESRPA